MPWSSEAGRKPGSPRDRGHLSACDHLPRASGCSRKINPKRVTIDLMKRLLASWKESIPATLRIATVAVLLCLAVAHPPRLRAQSPPPATQLHFDVASVKSPADQSLLETRPRRTVGRFL